MGIIIGISDTTGDQVYVYCDGNPEYLHMDCDAEGMIYTKEQAIKLRDELTRLIEGMEASDAD